MEENAIDICPSTFNQRAKYLCYIYFISIGRYMYRSFFGTGNGITRYAVPNRRRNNNFFRFFQPFQNTGNNHHIATVTDMISVIFNRSDGNNQRNFSFFGIHKFFIKHINHFHS